MVPQQAPILSGTEAILYYTPALLPAIVVERVGRKGPIVAGNLGLAIAVLIPAHALGHHSETCGGAGNHSGNVSNDSHHGGSDAAVTDFPAG